MPRNRPQRTGDPNDRVENLIPRAIRDGNGDALRRHIQHADEKGWLTDNVLRKAMRTACEKNDIDSMRLLLERATPETVNGGHPKTQETLLMAVKSKELAQVLLEKGADPNAIDASGRSALMRAASSEIAEVILDAGAAMETECQQARSALMHVLMQEKPSTVDARADIAHLLIRKNANIEYKDTQHRTILMTAVWRNHITIVRTLLKVSSNINATDLRGRNILHHLCEDPDRAKRMRPSPSESDISMVDLIVRSKVDVNAQDTFEGKTPLHRAIERNNTYIVRALLKKTHILVNTADFRNKTPLHAAAMTANNEIIQALLQNGANPRAESDGGWTALITPPLHAVTIAPLVLRLYCERAPARQPSFGPANLHYIWRVRPVTCK